MRRLRLFLRHECITRSEPRGRVGDKRYTYTESGVATIADKTAKKQIFLKSYIEAIGAPSGLEAVDKLLLVAGFSWLAYSIHNNGSAPDA